MKKLLTTTLLTLSLFTLGACGGKTTENKTTQAKPKEEVKILTPSGTPLMAVGGLIGDADNVEINNCFDDLLSINGTLLVLIKWIINVCDNIPNTNHPLWNITACSMVLNLNTNHNTQKHNMSKTVLINPKLYINFLIPSAFHVFGF